MIRSNSAKNRRTLSSCQSIGSGSDNVKTRRPSSSISSRRYSVKSNHSSEVDELLFGSAAKQCNSNYQTQHSVATTTKPRSYECKNERRFIRVITPETYTHLHEVNHNKKEKSLTLTGQELQRLLDYTLLNNKESDQFKKKELESIQRRREFANYDKIRHSREKNSDSQNEEEEKARNLIQRAWEERVEHEAEVKEISDMIKVAKIQTIRDRQIQEKQILQQLQFEEDQRLNRLMAHENDILLNKQRELDKERVEKEYICAHSMIQQIEENKARRLQELELLATENLQAKLEADRAIHNNMMRRQMSIAKQRKRRDEFVIANKDIIERKIIEKAKEKLIDERIMKIQWEKNEKERLKEEEILRKKFEREKECERMRAMQEKYQDLQSKRDELLERRSDEAAQRKWRESELQEEIKKRKVEEETKMIRAIQRHMKVSMNAAEASKEKKLFEYIYQKEKKLLETEKMEEITKQNKKHKYAKALADQIEQHKIQNLVDNCRRMLENAQMAKYDESRQSRIREAQLRILEESRSSGVAEKYLVQIQNRINHPAMVIRH